MIVKIQLSTLHKPYLMSVCFNLILLLFCWFGDTKAEREEQSPALISGININDWQLRGKNSYFPQNLYEYINGAAELYVCYDFEELQIYIFTRDSSEIVVELYKFSNSTNAFGIYSRERNSEKKYMDIACQGYVDYPLLIILHSRYYIKINSYRIAEEDFERVVDFAAQLSLQLGPAGNIPEILSSFPLQGKITNSEKYFADNFLGYDIFKGGYSAEYRFNNDTFKLFIVEFGNSYESSKSLEYCLHQTGFTGEFSKGEIVSIDDRNIGPLLITAKGKYIVGCMNVNGSFMPKDHIRKLLDQL